MYFTSAKVWLSLVALLVFLSSCSREGPEPSWEAESHFGNDYKGGLFPVYITLREPVDNASRVSWSTRWASIAYRKQGTNSKGQITADTAFLHWEKRPPVFEKKDTTKVKKEDGTESLVIVTTPYYRDTIFAIVNNMESLPIVIEVKNILPRIKSITVGGAEKPGDSLLTIAANLGDKLQITLKLEKEFEDTFNSAFHPIVTMPPLMGNPKLNRELSSEKDLVYVYEWTVPNKEISDSTEYLKIEDSGGFGERLYKVHLVVYTECGSIWVAAEKELVKYSPEGTEVARISQAKGDFNSISDISVNSKNGKLLVTDEAKNSFSIYDNYGIQLYTKKDFRSPSGIAIDLDAGYVWVADAKAADISTSSGSSSASATSSSSVSVSFSSSSVSSVFEARLRRFALMSDELKEIPTSVVYEMPGPIKGLSINQFQSNFVWFATPKNNKVGFTVEPPDPKFIEPQLESSSSESSVNSWKRPSMVSLDPSNGMAWIADSSRVLAIDTSGRVWAKITGFEFVSSVSASKGNVWASDRGGGKGRVYLFKGPFKGTLLDTSLTVIKGISIGGFTDPISVSAYIADGGAWVIDKETGMATRLDSLGNKIAFGTGLKQPILGKTLQKVE